MICFLFLLYLVLAVVIVIIPLIILFEGISEERRIRKKIWGDKIHLNDEE